MENKIIELTPIYDYAESFYGKAKIVKKGDIINLYSVKEEKMKKLEKMIRNANEGARYWSLEGEKTLLKHLENMQDENDFEIQKGELDRDEYLEIEVDDFKKEYLNMEKNYLDYS